MALSESSLPAEAHPALRALFQKNEGEKEGEQERDGESGREKDGDWVAQCESRVVIHEKYVRHLEQLTWQFTRCLHYETIKARAV